MRGWRSRSLKSTILELFIPIIILFVLAAQSVSYLLASQQLEQNAFTSIFDIVSQTKGFLNDKLTEVVSDLTVLDKDTDLASIVNSTQSPAYELQPEDHIRLHKLLDQAYVNHYPTIDSVLMYFHPGQISLFKKNDLATTIDVPLSMYQDKMSQKSLSVYQWLNLHTITNRDREQDEQRVVSVYKLYGKDLKHANGIVMLNIKEKFFKEILNNPIISPNGYLGLISEDGFMSFRHVDPKYELPEEELQKKLLHATEASGKIYIKSDHDENLLVIYDTLPINKWKLAAVVPESELLEKVSYFKYVTFTVMVILIMVAALLSNVLANFISKPIIQLTRKVNRIKEGHLDIKLDRLPNHEIGVLDRGICEMIERIKVLLVQVEEEQEKKRMAEMIALQFQIQPHFLYNTLYSIKQLCDMGETKDAGEMVTALAQFFRISISQGNEIIQIAQEMDHIRHYLYIQQMRYGDDFTYEIDLDPALGQYSIVKLTLQPLIENAIYHGIKEIRGKGHIRIYGYEDGEDAVIKVADTGAGMPSEKLSTVNACLKGGSTEGPGLGFGIMNVHKRLQLNYGSGYGLHFESEHGKGTTVTVRIRTHSLSDKEAV
ncbi:sensor histidine kinase [Paenibacillus cremeus]|nr:sensor histidine kinase [Paenibacillus cremeus]